MKLLCLALVLLLSGCAVKSVAPLKAISAQQAPSELEQLPNCQSYEVYKVENGKGTCALSDEGVDHYPACGWTLYVGEICDNTI